MEYYDYDDYKNVNNKKKFAIIEGSTNDVQKDDIKTKFNSGENDNGKLIKIIIGSPTIKEGISFMRLSHIHIFEPLWNYSNYLQVIGRGYRYCSHKTLPASERVIYIHKYIGHVGKIQTIDEYIYNLCDVKQEMINNANDILKRGGIIKHLFE